MFRHPFLLTYCNWLRFKSTFFVNQINLSMGLACALCIYLRVHNAFHVDKFPGEDNQLFQVIGNIETPAGIKTIHQTQILGTIHK